jgi:hypothetical protein
MWPDDNQLITKKSIGFCKIFPDAGTEGNFKKIFFCLQILNLLTQHPDDVSDNLGGFLCNGKYGWLAKRSLLQIVSIENGNKIATFNFDSTPRTKNVEITCVEEIKVEHWTSCVLAVGLQFPETGGLICILSVQGSRLLHAIDIYEKVTSCSFISTEHCARGVLQTWDSGLAIGTEQGKIFLFELDLQLCKNGECEKERWMLETIKIHFNFSITWEECLCGLFGGDAMSHCLRKCGCTGN